MSDQRPEPIFNAPWPAFVVAAVVFLPWFVVNRLGNDVLLSLALIPDHLWHGRWTGLVAALFVPRGLAGASFDAIFALAFGAPLARLMGVNGRGGGIFFLFYLTCGVLAALGYAGWQLAELTMDQTLPALDVSAGTVYLALPFACAITIVVHLAQLFSPAPAAVKD